MRQSWKTNRCRDIITFFNNLIRIINIFYYLKATRLFGNVSFNFL